MAEQKFKEKLDRSASNARRRHRGTPGNARGAPTEHFQHKEVSKYMSIVVIGNTLTIVSFFDQSISFFFPPLLKRVFTRKLPVAGNSASSVQPYSYPERL